MDNYLLVDLVSLSINLICLFVVVIVVYGNFLQLNERKTDANILFMIYGISLIVGVASDTLSFVGEVYYWPDRLQWIINTVSFVSGGIISFLFVKYLFEIISERTEVAIAYYFISGIICTITCLVDLFGCLVGRYFTITNGEYMDGPWVDISAKMSIAFYVWMLIVVIRFIKALGAHNFVAFISYILVPTIGSVVYMYTGISIEYAMMVLSVLFIFVMVQADIQKHSQQREKVLLSQSLRDEMTGLYNRNAHDSDMESFEALPANFTYMSLDLNGLKIANDTLGHAVGDELIKGVAECLIKTFGSMGKCYRIGGDEFACTLDVSKEEVLMQLAKFDENMAAWSKEHNMALSVSYGYANISEFNHVHNFGIDLLMKVADGRMYKNKADYYEGK